MARLRGTQTKERSRVQLDSMLGNIDALRSARGASLDSQTGQLIEKRTRADAYREEGIGVLAEMQRRADALQAAKGFDSASRWAIPMSILGAAGSAAQAFSYGSMAMGGPSASKLPGEGKMPSKHGYSL